MTEAIDHTRRLALPLAMLFAAGAGVQNAAAKGVAPAKSAAAAKSAAPAAVEPAPAQAAAQARGQDFGLDPTSQTDQTAKLQAAIDQTAHRGATLVLPPGTFATGGLQLRPGTRIVGAGATLAYTGNGALLSGRGVHGLRLTGLRIDGRSIPADDALIMLAGSRNVWLNDVTIHQAGKTALRLDGVSGRVTGCTISKSRIAAILSVDAAGLEICHNTIDGCGDNGILIWRSRHGEDGTMVAFNRISGVTNVSGGSGQYGNGIGIYRAGRVSVANNRITDCAYSGVRANEASNVQMTANSCERLGEVALYAEAADERAGASGFEGALIANNFVDVAATGIVVTNFNNGGRLAVVQGNLIRNLLRREHERVDKRGEGIAVEADAVVANNVIENAPTCGIMIGWGRHMREVVATGNLIRRSRIGIAVTGDTGAGQCLIAQNMISDARDGAIRAMDNAKPIGADMIGGKGPRHVVLAGNVSV